MAEPLQVGDCLVSPLVDGLGEERIDTLEPIDGCVRNVAIRVPGTNTYIAEGVWTHNDVSSSSGPVLTDITHSSCSSSSGSSSSGNKSSGSSFSSSSGKISATFIGSSTGGTHSGSGTGFTHQSTRSHSGGGGFTFGNSAGSSGGNTFGEHR